MEYEVTAFEPGDYKDNYGNYWCNAAFAGVSEPVRWVIKDPTTIKVGMKVTGKITDETGKSGKPYRRFRREQPQEHTYTKPTQDKPTEQYWDDKNKSIRAQFAIKTAVQAIGARTEKNLAGYVDEVAEMAKELFSMVDRVANPEPEDKQYQEDLANTVDKEGDYDLSDIPF